MTARAARAAIAAAIVAALSAAPALAAGPRPVDLRVAGGEESWHSQRLFSLSWTNPAPVGAVHYRLLDPAGAALIGDTRLPWPATALEHLSVPHQAGVYTAEIWLEDPAGSLGEPVTAKLRFDDVRPAPVAAVAPQRWLGRSSFPYSLRLNDPAAPPPLSGLRGYAVSIDASPGGHPCPSGRCADADLDAGWDADSVAIAALPEGVSYAHAVAVSGSGVASVPSSTVIRVDETYPHTVLEGVPSGWRKEPVTLTARASDATSGMAIGGPGVQPYTAIRVDGGAPTIAAGDSATVTVIGSGVHTVAFYARDAAGNVDDGSVLAGRPNRSPETVTVKIDREPPRLAFAVAQNPADPERLEARAADSGAGLDPARGSIAVRRAGGGGRYEPLPTWVGDGLLRARWDSSAFPVGQYEFRATAYDRAGNSATSSTRANGAPMRLHAPLKLPVRLETRSGGRAVRYGRGIWFGGRLLVGRHTPLAGVTIRVIERFAAGAEPAERVTAIRSGADGRFGLRLPPGPSRQVNVEVAPTTTSRAAASEPLHVSVPSRLALRVSSRVARVGGAPIVFRGRLAREGAAIPADGKVVQLQFRLPGVPWSEFRTVRSDRLGRFRYAYRFSDDDSRGVRFQFRAYAPAQAGWPFEPAGSLPVVVRGV